MNEATYVYIVHSDINENNIYAEFATEEEALDYARRHKDELTYVDKVEAALDEDGEIIEMFDSETIWVYDEEDEFELEEEINEFDIDFEDEHPLDEGIHLRNDAEREEFWRLCDEIGIYTANDLIRFRDEVGCTDENILQALRDYRAELGPDFKIANPELEKEMAKKYEGIDFDGLVEELEENEDMVECKECYELVAKESCTKGEHGYVCEKCTGKLEEAFSKPIFYTHSAYGPYKINYFDGGFDARLKSQQIHYDPNMRIRIVKVSEGEKPEYIRMTLGEFADLLDAEGIKYIGQKGRKPITEEVSSGLTPEQLAAMDAYLRSGKDLSLDDFEEEHDFGIDLVGGELTYNSKTNDFTFYLSIYHASEDNNAEYPEYHTDEEEYNFDTIEEVYDEFPQYLEDIYKWHAGKFSKLEEAKCKDCGGELKDNKCTSCNRDFNLAKCKYCGGEVKDGKCTHCDTKVDMVKCQHCGGEVVDNKCTSCNEIFEEAIKMTRDELMNKEGTDDVELINAGRPEEERVELIEDGLDPHTVIARVERWLENKDRPLYIFNGPKTLEEITNYLESNEISYRVVDAKDGYVESNGDIIIYVANESRQYIPELWEDPAIMLTPTYGHNVVSAYDFNTKESCWALDQLVRKMFKKFNGISADALRQLHKTYKHMSNTALGKTFADCETLSDVVDKLDPYFDFAMTKSLYHRDVESYDKIINDLPDAIWEVLNK